ncbi:AMP-binding protein [bacterium]|nr:AMP-binding protein [candidate division CSSED10-310 bacterium]
MLQENLVEFIENSLKSNWFLQAYNDYGGQSLTYRKVAERIIWLQYIFKKSHMKNGDKIALVGRNSSNWAITYLATITYGAVIVPILPDFNPTDIHYIVNHSDSTFLFTADSIYESLDESKMSGVDAIVSLRDFRILHSKKRHINQAFERADSHYLDEFSQLLGPDKLKFEQIPNDTLAAIVYTSGTTGFSKGVMLQHNCLMANIRFAITNLPLNPGDRILSFLPLAHAYGCAFEFLFPTILGCHITFLSKIPTPKILVKAFQEIKPQLILTVPLILEKIYRKQIKPVIEKTSMKLLLKLPVIRKILLKSINHKLHEVFGGKFHEVVIGGAPLNQEVELFFREIGFPYTIGYGMTECGPLISYSNWKTTKLFSVGKIIDTLEVSIASSDPNNEVGEILVRGENVMAGYYKNDDATSETIDKEGWLHTGDLGVIDEDRFIYIKGRCKSMLLGPSGQNIYPEEIEAKINNLPYVQESLVIEKTGKLFALIYPDLEMAETKGITEENLKDIFEENRRKLNKELPAYSIISQFQFYPEEFEKTPSKKIKRYLYTRLFS